MTRWLCLSLLFLVPAAVPAEEAPPADRLLDLLFADVAVGEEVLSSARAGWHDGLVAPLLEVLRFSNTSWLNRDVLEALEAGTGQRHGGNIERWYEWLWGLEISAAPGYAEFKSRLYARIDPAFGGYFLPGRAAEIRLDEVIWGGVVQDGIPPLREPEMIDVAEASYLADDHVVFGLEVQGDARAYPKRILGWHEMFTDTIGGLSVAGVYCTLCGSMILYETTVDGVHYDLGTSGFLYRSNKLMYDQATQSLWNTLWGRPVIGPLVGRNIELARRSVLTTTWGEWRRRHPDTRVLSLDTGYEKDYSEGAAYREYFATDRLMFTVPKTDGRLKNKAEVLALLSQDGAEALAISARYLAKHPLHHDRIGATDLVVATDPSGANRVYDSDGVRFVEWDGDRALVDAHGEPWVLAEADLTAGTGKKLARFPAHRAFWFGWFAAYPSTRLVH